MFQRNALEAGLLSAARLQQRNVQSSPVAGKRSALLRAVAAVISTSPLPSGNQNAAVYLMILLENRIQINQNFSIDLLS